MLKTSTKDEYPQHQINGEHRPKSISGHIAMTKKSACNGLRDKVNLLTQMLLRFRLKIRVDFEK